jgi:hypothetical protein
MGNNKERIAKLEEQAEQAKTLWIKCQGAIEVLGSMDSEDLEKDKKDVATEKKK